MLSIVNIQKRGRCLRAAGQGRVIGRVGSRPPRSDIMITREPGRPCATLEKIESMPDNRRGRKANEARPLAGEDDFELCSFSFLAFNFDAAAVGFDNHL